MDDLATETGDCLLYRQPETQGLVAWPLTNRPTNDRPEGPAGNRARIIVEKPPQYAASHRTQERAG